MVRVVRVRVRRARNFILVVLVVVVIGEVVGGGRLKEEEDTYTGEERRGEVRR